MKTQYFKIVFILSFALLFNNNIYAQDFQGKATYISKSNGTRALGSLNE